VHVQYPCKGGRSEKRTVNHITHRLVQGGDQHGRKKKNIFRTGKGRLYGALFRENAVLPRVPLKKNDELWGVRRSEHKILDQELRRNART